MILLVPAAFVVLTVIIMVMARKRSSFDPSSGWRSLGRTAAGTRRWLAGRRRPDETSE